MEEVANENENTKMFKVNVDEESELAVKLGIRNIPTVLFFKNGEIVDRSVGMLSKPKILELIEKNQ